MDIRGTLHRFGLCLPSHYPWTVPRVYFQKRQFRQEVQPVRSSYPSDPSPRFKVARRCRIRENERLAKL
jgi:hypothetical protein